VPSTDVLSDARSLAVHGREPIYFFDYSPATESLIDAVHEGLRQSPKRLPPKLFYDERGSALFDEICRLPEYYPTRTEVHIMQERAAEMAAAAGSKALLIEYGSGSSLKTTRLLDALSEPAGYVPVDISQEHLLAAARRIARAYPELPVLPVCADYTVSFEVPEVPCQRRLAYFPGSTIGNFELPEAVAFLEEMRQVVGAEGAAIIGVDLQKDKAVLEAAYDDAAGVTARFNKNVLHRIARELDADVSPEDFRHEARYNSALGRIEMHLVSVKPQQITVGNETFAFAEGDSIHTENSYKYTEEGFARLASDAGWAVEQVWTDARNYFSVQYLRPA